MHVLPRVALHLLDPRGRCNRTDFLYAAIAIFALQVAFFGLLWQLTARFDHVTSLPANAAFVWMGCAAISRRLHDLGRSAWWMPASVGLWLASGFVLATLLTLILGPERMFPGAPAFWLVFGCLLAPPFAAALWLHLAVGEEGANRFGPPGLGDASFNAPADDTGNPTKAGDPAGRRIAAHA